MKNKIIVITGGAGGIGSVLVEKFLKEGAVVVNLSRMPSRIKGAINFKTDIAVIGDIKKAINQILGKFKKIDVLINCAGVQAPIGPFVENKLSDWERNIRVNLLGTAAASSAVLPYMIKKRRGSIINFAGGGATSSRPNFSAYAASKTAIARFTEVIADEVKKYGVRVNAVSPGAVNTAMTYEVLKAGKRAGKGELKDARDRLKNGGASPESAADLVLFLASDKSKGLSGKLISAAWDEWRKWNKRDIEKIMKSDRYTLRRIK